MSKFIQVTEANLSETHDLVINIDQIVSIEMLKWCGGICTVVFADGSRVTLDTESTMRLRAQLFEEEQGVINDGQN